MLTYLEAKNYRNLDLSNGITLNSLNVFVGANGSGKSNLIKIFRFLQEALTQPLADEQRGITAFDAAMGRFGNGRIANIALKKPNVVEFHFEMCLQPDYTHGFDLALNVRDENTVTIRSEALSRRLDHSSRDDTPFYYYQAHGRQPGVGTFSYYPDKTQQKTKFTEIDNLSTNETAFLEIQSRLEADAKAGIMSTPFFEGRRFVTDALKSWSFYESSAMSVASARQYRAELGTARPQLQASGENVIEVLHTLLNGESVAFEDDLNDAWKELYPQTGKLKVRTVGRSYLELQWFFDKSDKENYFTLDDMSDGTVRMLCWAVVLLSPKPPTLIVLDEPEAALHPAWLQVLAGWIRRAALKTQVIISTHSSDLLDYFTDDKECVRVFAQETINGNTRIVPHPLNLEKLAPQLEQGWKLGDLYRIADPSIGGWPW